MRVRAIIALLAFVAALGGPRIALAAAAQDGVLGETLAAAQARARTRAHPETRDRESLALSYANHAAVSVLTVASAGLTSHVSLRTAHNGRSHDLPGMTAARSATPVCGNFAAARERAATTAGPRAPPDACPTIHRANLPLFAASEATAGKPSGCPGAAPAVPFAHTDAGRCHPHLPGSPTRAPPSPRHTP